MSDWGETEGTIAFELPRERGRGRPGREVSIELIENARDGSRLILQTQRALPPGS